MVHQTDTALSTVTGVLEVLASGGRPGKYTIRPRLLLSQVEAALGVPRIFSLPFPSSGIGSITTLEATMLVAIEELLQPRRIFEFGTFLGYSTRLLALNAPHGCEVITIDLPLADSSADQEATKEDVLLDFRANDAYLTALQATDGPVYFGAKQLPNVTQLRGDSREFSVCAEGLAGGVDLVFVDGGHDYETARIDSQNALEMIGESGVILWHDVGSSLHTEVDSVIEQLASREVIIGIANTMLAFVVKGDAVGSLFGSV